MKYIPRLLDDSDIEVLRNLPEVVRARDRVPIHNFSVTLPDTIKQHIDQEFGITLPNRLPFRWIQGDTPVHIDSGASSFENTYLVYLTDGEGQFRVGGDSYPIEAGSGFVFSEGTQHGVTETNGTCRLLLGPMSEQGFPVGFGGTSVNADGATDTIYVEQIDDPSGNPVYTYRINNGDATSLVFPLNVTNTNATPASNILKVLFTTNLTLTSGFGYISIQTNGIQIGDRTLRNDGTKPTITIDGVEDYGGFVGNGGYSNTYIYNIHVAATNGSTLVSTGGWVGRYGYGSDGTNNYIIGCSSDGAISTLSGGIVGAEAANNNSAETVDLNIIGCSSSGAIDTGGGGIAGEYCGESGSANVSIFNCSSSGTIGADGGGIVGRYAGQGGAACQTEKCYSMGNIGLNAGGIFGRYAGDAGFASATGCYSRGDIGTDAGGIFGSDAAPNSGDTTATNCYSSGTITTTGNGIYGTGKSVDAIESNCYVADGSWNSSSASATLTMTAYVSIVANQPFELRLFGPSPYSLTTVEDNDVSLSFSQSIPAGSSSIASVLSGYSSYSILEGGDATITINSTTGAISTTSATPAATYTILVRAVTNPYSITTFTLTVTGGGTSTPSREGTIDVKGKSYDFSIYTDVQEGQRFVLERIERPNLRFNSFADYNKYLMAQASFRR